MDIQPISGGMPSIASQAGSAGASPSRPSGFAQVIDRLLEQVSAPAKAADQAITDLATGQTDNLHQVLLAVSQADLAFRLALEIRNRLTEAYQEIQRMQV